MSAGHRGADLLARTLARAGTRYLFTLSGNHVMPVFDAALDAGLELVHVRHEAAAVHMADAWARLTGEPGVALVTGGPGHANALSALYTAAMAEAPVVLLSGHAPHDEWGRGGFQEMRQADLAAPLAKAAWTCTSADTIASDIARALSIARSGRPGPVHLSLPTDALERDGAPQAPAQGAWEREPMPLPDAAAAQMMERLRAARHPLILCGPALMARPARRLLMALEDASGIPVVGMESPRGVNDPALGAFAEMLARADAILLLGKRLDFTLKFGTAPTTSPECAWLQVDPDEVERERARRAVGARMLAAHAADVYEAAAALARAASDGNGAAWRDDVRAAIAWRPPAWDSAKSTAFGRLHPVQACRPLQPVLDAHPESVLVSDGGEFGQWAQACVAAPNRVINGMAGAIGAALPFAVAARLAFPDAPVVAFLGDGTFGFHPAEIDTAVRHDAGFVAIVGNDARWNAEYQIQVRAYGRERAKGCELLPTRYDEVARAFGGYGESVTEAAGLAPAVARALASGLPACVNVSIEGLPAPNFKR